jgi:Nitrogen regulatory protein P-II
MVAKLRVDVAVEDRVADLVVDAIAKSVNTGSIGDGKIWVCPLESALRVRTGERDRAAILASERPVATTSSRRMAQRTGPGLAGFLATASFRRSADQDGPRSCADSHLSALPPARCGSGMILVPAGLSRPV